MAEVASEVSMGRTLKQLQREKRRTQDRGKRSALQRLRSGKPSRFGNAALAAMLGGQALSGTGAALREPGSVPADQQELQQTAPRRASAGLPQFTALSPEDAAAQWGAGTVNAGSDPASMRRELNQRQQQARMQQNTLPATLPQMQGQKEQQQKGAQESVDAETGEKPSFRSQLQELRNRVRQNKDLAKQAATTASVEERQQMNVTIRNSMRAGWTAVHETLEDLSLSFLDFMIISGPLTLFAFGLRLFSPLYGKLVTLRISGFEVPLIPSFTLPMLATRASKTLVIGLLTSLIWGTIFLLFYLATHPLEALKFMTEFQLAPIKLLFNIII